MGPKPGTWSSQAGSRSHSSSNANNSNNNINNINSIQNALSVSLNSNKTNAFSGVSSSSSGNGVISSNGIILGHKLSEGSGSGRGRLTTARTLEDAMPGTLLAKPLNNEHKDTDLLVNKNIAKTKSSLSSVKKTSSVGANYPADTKTDVKIKQTMSQTSSPNFSQRIRRSLGLASSSNGSNNNSNNNNSSGNAGASASATASVQAPASPPPPIFVNPSSNVFTVKEKKEKIKPSSTIQVGWQNQVVSSPSSGIRRLSIFSLDNSLDSSSMIEPRTILTQDLELLSKLPVTYSSYVFKCDMLEEKKKSSWFGSFLHLSSSSSSTMAAASSSTAASISHKHFYFVLKSCYILVYLTKPGVSLDDVLPIRLLCISRCKVEEVTANEFILECEDGTRSRFRTETEEEKLSWMRLLNQASNLATLDDFEPIANLAHGHFGRVFLVRHKSTSVPMALKEIPVRVDKPYKQFEERSILGRLSTCPFVARLFFSFREGGNLYYISEFGAGGDLWALLRKCKKLSEQAAMFIAAEMVCVVEAMHSRGIVHRDIKLENILFDHHGHIKVVDFGLSKVLRPKHGGALSQSENDVDNDVYVTKTVSGYETSTLPQNLFGRTYSICGTNYYMPPEMLLGEGHSLTIDWWQIGCLVHELLIGVPTYYAKGAKKIHARILEGPPIIPNSGPISPAAKDLILSFMSHDPELRLGSKGSYEVKAHPFFTRYIGDWSKVEKKQLQPPSEITGFLGFHVSTNSSNNHSPFITGNVLLEKIKKSFPEAVLVNDFERKDSVLGGGGGEGGIVKTIAVNNTQGNGAGDESDADGSSRSGGSSLILRSPFGRKDSKNEIVRQRRVVRKSSSNRKSSRRRSIFSTLGFNDKDSHRFREPYIGFEFACTPTLLADANKEYHDIGLWSMQNFSKSPEKIRMASSTPLIKSTNE